MSEELEFIGRRKCSIIPCLEMKDMDCKTCPIKDLEEFIENLVKECNER